MYTRTIRFSVYNNSSGKCKRCSPGCGGYGYGACVACGLPFLFHGGAKKYLSFVRAQHGSPRPVDHEFVRRSVTILSFFPVGV